MKGIYSPATVILVLCFISIGSAFAQKISIPSLDFKKDMLGVFAPDDSGLDIDNSKKDELRSANSEFLDQVISIANGDGSDEDKKKSILSLGKNQSSTFSKILGKDKAKSYKKSIKKKIRPFKTKYKIATLIL
ncbi:hypothetical protein [Algoriphagus sp.]|uniref:hypothetical protein n=1 Tax=Algoriphagus sp. TaxID=1872435 RepID=UPI0025FC2E47|nr:hypothetical protein [Algoriphagus sp.]